MIFEDPAFTDYVRRARTAEDMVERLESLVQLMALGIPKEKMPDHIAALLDEVLARW